MEHNTEIPRIVKGNKFRLLITLEAVDSQGQPVPLPIVPEDWTVRVKTMTSAKALAVTGKQGEQTLVCDVPANALVAGTHSLEAFSGDYRYSKQQAFVVVEWSADAGLPTEQGEDIEVQTIEIRGTIDKGGGGGGTSDYNDLDNKPCINGTELVGDVPTADLHIPYADIEGAPAVPTKTSDLENDVPFASEAFVDGKVAGKADKTYVDEQLAHKAEVSDIAHLTQSIADEEAARKEADGLKLDKSSVKQEAGQSVSDVMSQKAVSDGLTAVIDGATEAIGAEATARMEADASLQSQISAKADKSAVTAEQSARQAADADLQMQINGKASAADLQAEATARANADALLQPKNDTTLETESTTIVGAINELRANLVQEGQTRAAADNAVQEELDTKVTSIPAQEGNPFVYGRMNSEAGGTEGKFTMSADVVSGCVVKRNGDSSILVRTSPTRDNEAVGKVYAEQVKQTQSTTNGYFPLIHKVNGDNAERIAQVYFNGKVAMNPSTGDVKATTFTEGGTALASKYATMTYVDEKIGEIELALQQI